MPKQSRGRRSLSGRTWGRRIGWWIGSGALLILASIPVSAHEVQVQRFTTPIPLSVLFVGAAAVVAVTAVISARVIGEGTALKHRRRIGHGSWAWLGPIKALVRLLAVLVVGGLLWVGLFGRQVRAENLATVVVWPLWFDGLALLAALVGSPWTVLSPWRTIHTALSRLEGEVITLSRYPVWLGAWPAVVTFAIVIGILENLTVVPLSPRSTAVVVAIYGLFMVGGGVVFGPTWFERADFIEVFLRLFGRLSPVRMRVESSDDTAIVVRAPWHGCVQVVRGLGGVAFVIATVFTISFDGYADTRSFQTVTIAAANGLGITPGESGILAYVVGLAVALVVFVAVVGLVRIVGGSTDRRTLCSAFAPTVLPIAVGYEFAHYGTYVIQNAAVATHLTLDLLMAAPPEFKPLAGLTLPVYWGFQVIAIVVGHVIAVVAAHYVAVQRFEDAATAWRAHLPLVTLMVGYTVLSLWIISQPVVV